MFARELSYRIRIFYTSRINGFKGMNTCLLDPLRVKKTKQNSSVTVGKEGRLFAKYNLQSSVSWLKTTVL